MIAIDEMPGDRHHDPRTGRIRESIPRRLHPLRKRLLDIGGERVVVTEDVDHDEILSRGIALNGGATAFPYAPPSSCHATAAVFWVHDPGRVKIMTGYALSDDGCWRRHSWARSGELVLEPTVMREKYFGYELNRDETIRFVVGELWARYR